MSVPNLSDQSTLKSITTRMIRQNSADDNVQSEEVFLKVADGGQWKPVSSKTAGQSKKPIDKKLLARGHLHEKKVT